MGKKSLVGLLFFGVGLVGCSGLQEEAVRRPPEVDRGRYMVEIMGCNDCHTPGYMGNTAGLHEEDWLVGGTLGFYGSWGTAYPANLRLLLNEISETEWMQLARKMRRNSPMAWSNLPNVSDDDLRAVYQFVRYLGPKGGPAPASLPAGVKPTTQYISFPEPH